MTSKQSTFISEYLVSMNATAAAKAAGYSEKSARAIGCELLTKPDIALDIRKRQQQRGERTQTDADWVITELVANHTMAREKGDIGASTRALELIGKHHGAFLDRVQTQPENINVEIILPDRSIKSTQKSVF